MVPGGTDGVRPARPDLPAPREGRAVPLAAPSAPVPAPLGAGALAAEAGPAADPSAVAGVSAGAGPAAAPLEAAVAEALAEEPVTVTDVTLSPEEQGRVSVRVLLDYQGTELSVSAAV